jgi:hypothetical protein
LVAVQAQDFAGAKWAVGMRLPSATDVEVERAFNEGALLRTHALRPTWHFMVPEDIRWLLGLTGGRVHGANGPMYARLNLQATTFDRAQTALTLALRGGRNLTRGELGDVLRQAGVAAEPGQRLAYLMMHAELDGVICSGPRRGKQFTYALLDERAPDGRRAAGPEALVEFARRYFVTRGPATVQDFAKWSGLTVAEARQGLDGARGELRHASFEGGTYWFAPGAAPRRVRTPSARLISVYDEYISGYADRRAIVSERDGARLVGQGNALTSVVLIDGRILGTWKRVLQRDTVVLRITLFRRLRPGEHEMLIEAGDRYGRFHRLPAKVVRSG